MRKTFKSIMFVAAAAMAFTACNVEQVETPEKTIGTHKVTFVASQAETKTTMEINNGIASFAWENTDKAYFHIFENGVGATGDDIGAELVNGIMNISAIFPVSSAPYTYTGFMAATVSNDNPAVSNEQIDLGAYDPESDILVAKPVTDKAPEDIVEGILFQFKRVVAINQMTLKGLTAGETVTEVTITSDKPIAGEYDFANGAWNASGTSISIDAEAVANTDGQAVVYFVSAPVEGVQLTVTATTAAVKTYSKKLAKTITFNEGGVKAFGVTVEENSPVPPTPVELFYESFDTNDGKGGNDEQWSGAIAANDIKSDNEGWVFVKGNGANECAKFGSGSAKGSATTPSIECTGDIILTFKAAAWNSSSEKTTLNISATSGTVSEASVTLVKGEWTEYTITISGVESSTQIKFEGNATSNNRFFLDEVSVVSATPDTRTALSIPSNLAVTGKIVSWTAVENAGSYLVTIGDNEPVVATTNSYDASAIADEYYDVSVIAVPTDTDTYKNSAAATLEGARFGDPWLTTPVLSAGAIDESSITVTWTNDSRATNGYQATISEDLGDGTLQKVSEQVNIMTGSVTFTGLKENQAYEISVIAMPVSEPRAYHFSSNGTIKLTTIAAQHVSDVTAAGNYTIKGLTVYASNGTNQNVVGDGTGYILDFGSQKTVGEIYTIAGNVEQYRGIWQFKSATGNKTGETQGAVTYPSPIEFTASEATSYIASPYINYVHFSGTADVSTGYISVGDVKMNVYNTTKGKTYDVLGFAIGYKNDKDPKYISVIPVTLTDQTPTLSVTPASKTWAYDETTAATFNVSAAFGTWSVNPTTLDWASVAVDADAGTITVTPNGQNTSEADYEATLTVTHSADASLTETIYLKQAMESGDDNDPVVLIIDGSKLTATATTSVTTNEFDGVTIKLSDGAKYQSSTGDNKFADKAILIGKSGKYIYNSTPIPGKITKFEIYANKGASAKVSVGVQFSDSALSEYATGSNTYTATLSTLDSVYDCSSKLTSNCKYFWYQVTNANNSQVQFRITYIPDNN